MSLAGYSLVAMQERVGDPEPRKGNPQMRFAIIASMRTGSSHFVTQLGRSKDICCHGEVFNARKVNLRWFAPPLAAAPDSLEAELRALRAEDPELFLKRIYALDFGRPHVGFKIFDHQHPSMLTRIIEDTDILKIVLIRANVLAVHSSETIAFAHGVWGPITREERAKIPPIDFDPEQFRQYHNRYIGFYARVLEQIGSTGQQCQLIRYEELNNPHMLARLVGSFGVTCDSGKFDVLETERDGADILSRYRNPDEVLDFLRAHSRLEWANEGEFSFAPLKVAPPI
jgi:hypothetical protein